MKISVIIPIYRVEKYLRQCVDSVLAQTYADIEVVLVDDGSPDNCPAICDEYAKKDKRVTVIHKENGGLSDARKQGILQATGEYLMIVDGDDWLEQNTVEKCVNQIKPNSGLDCVIFSYIREYPLKSMVSHVMDQSAELFNEKVEEKIYRRLFGLCGEELKHPERLENLGSCCMKLYRTDVAHKGKFFNTTEVGSSEDTLFNIFALYQCNHIIYMDDPLYHYRKRGNSITSTYRPRMIQQWNRLFDIMEGVIAERRLDHRYTDALNVRIALSALGIGMNELDNKQVSFRKRVKTIRDYFRSSRYQQAIRAVNIAPMPLAWKALMVFSKYKMAYAVSAELMLIDRIRRKY